jgi:hypothetical protein
MCQDRGYTTIVLNEIKDIEQISILYHLTVNFCDLRYRNMQNQSVCGIQADISSTMRA